MFFDLVWIFWCGMDFFSDSACFFLISDGCVVDFVWIFADLN